MSSYIVRRLLQVIPTIIISSILLFSLLNLMRGDAIDLYFGVSADRTPQAVAALKAQLGLDKPPVLQYLTWLGNVAHGDFGSSWRLQEPVLQLIAQHLQLSMELALTATVVSLVFSLTVGIYLAVHQGTLVDQVIRFVGLIFYLGAGLLGGHCANRAALPLFQLDTARGVRDLRPRPSPTYRDHRDTCRVMGSSVGAVV